MTRLSIRASSMRVSPIRNLVRPKNKDIQVYALNIGQPDLPSPPEFIAAVKSLDYTTLAYDSARGNQHLLESWSLHLNKLYNIECSDQNLVITQGSSEALQFALNICCDVGDEVIVFTPTYANYTGFATMAGVKLVTTPCQFSDNFHISTQIPVTDRTRAILLCSPNNPTGTTYTTQELQHILKLCEQHNLFLIVDEVYREFVYDGIVAQTIFQIAPKNPRIIVVDSLSKRYSLCGARVGCLLSWNSEVITAAINFASTRVSACTIEQKAAAIMLDTIATDYLPNAIKTYQLRRNLLHKAITQIPGVSAQMPEGGFYIFAQLPVTNAQDFARFMLQDFQLNGKTLFISPATGFYIQNVDATTSFVRIAFVLDSLALEESSKILESALLEYKKIAPS